MFVRIRLPWTLFLKTFLQSQTEQTIISKSKKTEIGQRGLIKTQRKKEISEITHEEATET